jgi:putative tricarboxylic transport membrane protein
VKFRDTASGLLTLLFGIAVIAYARTFPPMPGQNVGPAFFPTVVGCGLVLFGAVLLAAGARQRRTSWIELDEWTRKPRMLFNFVLVIADLVFYALAVDWLGFFITAFAFLSVLFLAFEVRRTWIVPIALAATLAIHYGFYTLLRVPLPWGPLERIAW